MTRRDFILIARTLRDAEARASVRLAMAKALATTNPKFDEKRFMRESEPKAKPELAGYGEPNWRAGEVIQPPTVGSRYTGQKGDAEAA